MFHLIRRFFAYLVAKPLAPSEQAIVNDVLTPRLARLFFSQPFQDQRHAFAVMRHTESDAPDAKRAALLHDVGKAQSRIGPIQRSLATICHVLRLPLPHRWRLYLDHGTIGARMLAEAGASDFVVAFTETHPGPPPGGVDAEAWFAVARADEA